MSQIEPELELERPEEEQLGGPDGHERLVARVQQELNQTVLRLQEMKKRGVDKPPERPQKRPLDAPDDPGSAKKGTKGKELENKGETRYLGPRGVLLRFSVPRAWRNLGKRNSYNGLFGWGRLLKLRK